MRDFRATLQEGGSVPGSRVEEDAGERYERCTGPAMARRSSKLEIP